VAFSVVIASLAASCASGGETGGGVQADRTIEVEALDELAFDPETIDASVGETIRFVVTNTGEEDHEFVVGDDEMQAMAEEEMNEDMHGHTAAMAALALAPGETKEATITFEEAGTFEYACHVASHYDGGMIGTLIVD
jgi:uncharacterized cupredoxin-like copper-binding protein